MGSSGNVFESLLARGPPSSALFENSKNLASYLHFDIFPDSSDFRKVAARQIDQRKVKKEVILEAQKRENNSHILLL